MSSTGTKTSPEIPRDEDLRDVDVDQLLERQLRLDELNLRGRRIAKAGHLWAKRKLLCKFCAWGAVITAVIAILIPSRYAATTRLMPPDPPQGQAMAMIGALTGRIGSSLGSLGGDLLGMKTSADLFSGVLYSRAVQDELVNKFELRKVYGVKRLTDARRDLSGHTDVAIDRKSGILTIQVTDNDPKRASAIAQEYVTQLNNVVTQLNTSSAHRERAFLEERLSEVKSELEIAEKDFSRFASKSGAIDIKEQGKAMVEAAAILQGQLIAARTEVQGLRQIYADTNIRVRTMQARVDELQRQLAKVGGVAETEETAAAQDNNLYPSIRRLPMLGVTYADLFRRTKVQETVFETLTQQYELAKVQEAKEVPSVKVLDPAEVPEKKVFPPRTLMVIVGAILSIGIGVAWILLTDDWRRIDPQDPGKLLVLEMVRSVKPPLEYVAQQRAAFSNRTRKASDPFVGDASAAETKQ
jgi:capsule polysaccharide export protein KpsE/RkpR